MTHGTGTDGHIHHGATTADGMTHTTMEDGTTLGITDMPDGTDTCIHIIAITIIITSTGLRSTTKTFGTEVVTRPAPTRCSPAEYPHEAELPAAGSVAQKPAPRRQAELQAVPMHQAAEVLQQG